MSANMITSAMVTSWKSTWEKVRNSYGVFQELRMTGVFGFTQTAGLTKANFIHRGRMQPSASSAAKKMRRDRQWSKCISSTGTGTKTPSYGASVFTDGATPCSPVLSEEANGTLHLHHEDGTLSGARLIDKDFDLIEVGPYDHIHDGDIVEIVAENGGRIYARWSGVTSGIGQYRGIYGISIGVTKHDTVRLVCRKENEEKP